MPADIDYAVEMYILPRDLPLFNVGNEVRLIFDGWPSIVFSGWPVINLWYLCGGEVVAIDRFYKDNGKYRILIAQDPDEPEWPEALRVGGGTNGLALLDIVPVWYEIWRQIQWLSPPNFLHFLTILGNQVKQRNFKEKPKRMIFKLKHIVISFILFM